MIVVVVVQFGYGYEMINDLSADLGLIILTCIQKAIPLGCSVAP